MSISVEVLFGKPQTEIASRLRERMHRCQSVSMVSGFATAEGLEQVVGPVQSNPAKLECLVVGAGTFRAFEAFDGLLDAGVAPSKLFVHLGMTRQSGGRKNPFARYRPMLHSKVYLFDMGSDRACAFVGSHNLTGFAMRGLNGEASVFLEGDAKDLAFVELRRHVTISVATASQYESWMKEAYAWWTGQFLDGLKVEINDAPKDSESRTTIIVMAASDGSGEPLPRERIYFELPLALAIDSLRPEFHVYVFDALPSSPAIGLQELSKARACLRCTTLGLDRDRGNREVLTDWYIDDRKQAVLRRAPTPFRPNPAQGFQQVRVQVEESIVPNFEYLFDSERLTWSPVLDTSNQLAAPDEDLGSPQKKSSRKRPEDGAWYPVSRLEPREQEASKMNQVALFEASPSSGSYIVVSPRRRRAIRGT